VAGGGGCTSLKMAVCQSCPFLLSAYQFTADMNVQERQLEDFRIAVETEVGPLRPIFGEPGERVRGGNLPRNKWMGGVEFLLLALNCSSL
jgi:hypothetical protein